MASVSLPPSSSKSKSEENPSDILADTKWWLHPQAKDNATSFWEPSWQTMKIEEYAELKKFNSIFGDPSQKNPHDDHLLMSENPEKLLSEMESQFNKTEPWWHTVELDDLAQINKPGERFVPDKGLASLDHVSNFTDSMPRSIGMNESHSPFGLVNPLSSTTPDEAENLQELSKAELLEALCHSQTRAREAEEAAQKAYNEKEHMITHFLKQASHLFAYKQWLHILQLETTCMQLRNSKYRLVYTRSPDFVTWVPTKDAKKVRRKAVKLNPGSPRFKIGKSFRSFLLGLTLAGAGLLLGWTLGWLFR